ncbi:hypothetical protein CLV30_12087 [Haloactinopolyspora alba]|uniref:HTTM-like domain-containing protein n=1 Tax=Haloactinopolyspora alba TaxID=648780 RepID=A0A2P8DM62_9ACTN|nr:hypothetical protein [Haloactinopolyspora alba]PSK98301.1 hypothetical protein CLV30_12087 [Haloactinopolyspora alba]
MSRVRGAGRAFVGWWTSPVPLARVAVLRAAIYLFLLYDIFMLTDDVIPMAHSPEFYQPKWLGRELPLPDPTVPLAQTLQIVLIIGSLIAATGFLPRIAGWTVAVAYFEWMILSQGYGYVSHDHLAFMVAVVVLPTIGRARFTDRGSSEGAGWAFRCIQVATIATYFFSAVVKWVRSGSPATWANGAVFIWALVRRGSDLFRWTTDYPWLLQIAQWGLLIIEFLSPVVLFLRRRALYLAVVVFVGFHLMTYLALGIHFLPTVVCWLAFLPLERLVDAARRGIGTLRSSRPATAG